MLSQLGGCKGVTSAAGVLVRVVPAGPPLEALPCVVPLLRGGCKVARLWQGAVAASVASIQRPRPRDGPSSGMLGREFERILLLDALCACRSRSASRMARFIESVQACVIPQARTVLIDS